MSAFPAKINLDAILAELNQGKHKSVLKQVKPLLKTKNPPAVVPNLAGIALCGLGKQREAVPLFKKALLSDPSFHDARKNLAQTLILLGQADKAMLHLNHVLAAVPNHPDALYLKAQALWNTGSLPEAERCLCDAIDADPDQGRLYNLRAMIRQAQGQEIEALADFEAALTANPNDVEALVNVSRPFARQIRHSDSQAVINRALALAPEHLGANLRQAALHVEAGETEAAIARYRQILSRSATQPEALEQLAMLLKGSAAQELEPALKSALKVHSRPSEDRARVHYGLARLARLRLDTKLFATNLARANGDMAGLFPYDAGADSLQTATILDQFSDAAASPPPSNASDTATPRPIFITGLPRSGTSLTEAVLGAHPNVTTLGERAAAGALLRPYLDGMQCYDSSAQQRFAADYSIRLPELAPETQVYTDKMPENYRYIGYLLSALPDCRIICMQRDPRDTALSMWQAHFSGQALAYCYDLTAMAHRFNLHAKMIAHWQRQFPSQILTLRYEDLTRDIEGESKRISGFSGLSWCPEMIHPGANKSPVLTLSANQLRQGVHQRSVGGWEAYAEILAPFIDALDPTLWPEIAGS